MHLLLLILPKSKISIYLYRKTLRQKHFFPPGNKSILCPLNFGQTNQPLLIHTNMLINFTVVPEIKSKYGIKTAFYRNPSLLMLTRTPLIRNRQILLYNKKFPELSYKTFTLYSSLTIWLELSVFTILRAK